MDMKYVHVCFAPLLCVPLFQVVFLLFKFRFSSVAEVVPVVLVRRRLRSRSWRFLLFFAQRVCKDTLIGKTGRVVGARWAWFGRRRHRRRGVVKMRLLQLATLGVGVARLVVLGSLVTRAPLVVWKKETFFKWLNIINIKMLAVVTKAFPLLPVTMSSIMLSNTLKPVQIFLSPSVVLPSFIGRFALVR